MRLALLFLILPLILSSCGKSATTTETTANGILTTTTFLADIKRNVVGDRATVESLPPVGADPHSYQPVPEDVAKLSRSAVLIINGLEYEEFLTPLLENAGGSRLIITASNGLEPLQIKEDDQAVNDPHIWLDPNRVVK